MTVSQGKMLNAARTRPVDVLRDDDWFTDPARGRRGQRRRERQQIRRTVDAELAPEPSAYLHGPLFDWSDCRHGCNGDCIVLGGGSDVCDFTCHPGLEVDPARAAQYEARLREMQA